jgi:hypothetical protein
MDFGCIAILRYASAEQLAMANRRAACGSQDAMAAVPDQARADNTRKTAHQYFPLATS